MKFWQRDKPKNRLTVFTFHTVSEALHFEKALRGEGQAVRLRPVPRTISSSCGTCAAVAAEAEPQVLEAVKALGLSYHELHRVKE